jgi:hypothetical protein
MSGEVVRLQHRFCSPGLPRSVGSGALFDFGNLPSEHRGDQLQPRQLREVASVDNLAVA